MTALARTVRGTRNADAISVAFCLTHNQTKTQSVDSLCVKQLSDKSTDGPQLAEATEVGVVLESRTAARRTTGEAAALGAVSMLD